MTPEIIIDAFKKQVALCDRSQPFQVFYVTTRTVPPGPDPFGGYSHQSEVALSIELAVYDVAALVEKFENHICTGFHGKDDALPKFEPITLLIP